VGHTVINEYPDYFQDDINLAQLVKEDAADTFALADPWGAAATSTYLISAGRFSAA